MAENTQKWLASRKKRNRDIRDFIAVNHKIIKPCPAQQTRVSSTSRDLSKKTRQAPFPGLRSSRCKGEYRRQSEVKIPASCFSKGVRKKTSVIATQEDKVSNGVESRATAGGDTNTTYGGKKRLTNLDEKENFHLSQTSTRTCKEKRPAATRGPLRLLPSQSPDREEGNPSTSTPLPITRVPPITMEISSPLLFSPDPSTSQHPFMTEDELPPQEPCLCNILQPMARGITSPGGEPLSPSFSLSESLQIESLGHVSWDTERLLAELSSCEKL